MTRYKWLSAQLPTSIRVVADRMKEEQFTDKSNDGFIVDRVREDFLEARYIEKLNHIENIVDPFGKELFFERIHYNQCLFRVFVREQCLEIVDPPRTLNRLFAKLSLYSDFNISLGAINVDVETWYNKFEEKSSLSMLVEQVDLSVIIAENGNLANVSIKGGRNLIGSFGKFEVFGQPIVKKLKVKFSGNHSGVFEIARSGTLNISSGSKDLILAALRTSLLESIS